ncbi:MULTISPECIES: putative toxin-antitoxin system toxin component, PIN family [Sphingobacterium]|uniref:Toxin-antitoxin system toxin component, PIN family n=1 Tax=Sphingobacterium tenebrionis TaxID=3111775 RepID=A0ABU8I4P5_9SPHI|nr:putative toxin-antitoxin system toxin component, PIN family [Sphingobacterium sp. CZ-2]QBR11528.1 putative toxin-antitoxin system toxin component, PIN family [Sphingobacterium sp. CZ-2]
MSNLKVILDTNVILRSISRRSTFSVLLDKIYNGDFEVYVTNDILLEYEEKISDIFSKETAELVLGALTLLPNVKKVEVHFQLGLIRSDSDDNKFVDCAFAANSHYLVSNDRHFDALKQVDFPIINVISLEKFIDLIS